MDLSHYSGPFKRVGVGLDYNRRTYFYSLMEPPNKYFYSKGNKLNSIIGNSGLVEGPILDDLIRLIDMDGIFPFPLYKYVTLYFNGDSLPESGVEFDCLFKKIFMEKNKINVFVERYHIKGMINKYDMINCGEADVKAKKLFYLR